jgi:hypothetical protein
MDWTDLAQDRDQWSALFILLLLLLLLFIYLNCKWVFTQWQLYYNKTQHTNNTSHKITHHTQTKHSTQIYTNNKGHITHNEYNANTITTTIK